MKTTSFILIPVFLLVLLFCLPLIMPLNRVVVEESYLQLCSYADLNVISILKWQRIPMWSFHFGGGFPFIKHPDNIVLSPLFYLLILPFGSANGFKLLLVFSYFIGVSGFFIFVRKLLGCGAAAALIATLFFTFNSFIAFQVNTGNLSLQLWFFLPLIIYTLFRSKEDGRHVFYCAFLLTLVFLTAFGLAWASLVLFLAVIALLDLVPAPRTGAVRGKPLLFNFALVLLITFLLGAVKFLPLLELLSRNIRGFDLYPEAAAYSMTLKKMFLAFFSRGPYAVGNEKLMGPNGLGMGSVMYFGIIPAVFFALSCAFCFKKIWKYLVAFIIFLLFCMADNSPLDLFHLLWRLPLFHSMHEVARYFSFPVVFTASVIAGAFFASDFFRGLNKKIRYLVYLVALIGAADMFVANTQYYRFTGTYQSPEPEMRIENDFFNVRGIAVAGIEQVPSYDAAKKWTGKYAEELPSGLQYYLLRQNIGLVNWFSKITLPENAIPRYGVTPGYGDYWKDFRGDISPGNGIFPNKNYSGESFFAGGKENRVKGVTWKPDEIAVEIEQPSPGVLVVNQNYDKEWVSDKGEVIDKNGLIGVRLDRPGATRVVLRYASKAFSSGLIISCACFLFCLFALFRRKAAERPR